MPLLRNYRKLGAADTNAAVIKASGTHLRAVQVSSLDATPVYVKFYDKATTPAETDTPIYSVECPAPATAALGAVVNVQLPGAGLPFEAGLAVRMVTGYADNSTGALTASEVILNAQYD